MIHANTSTLLSALNLRPLDAVRSAHAAEALCRLLAWLKNGARQFTIWQCGDDSWCCDCWDDGTTFHAQKRDPIDALSHALQCAEAGPESEPFYSGERDTRAPECAEGAAE